MASLKLVQDQPFRFFQLPRELRDQIYALLGSNLSIKNPGIALGRVTMENSPEAVFRLVSRQFTTELDKELAGRQTLVIKCAKPSRHCVPDLLYRKDFPPLFGRTERIRWHLFFGTVESLQSMLETLGPLGAELRTITRALPKLRSVELVCHTSTRTIESYAVDANLDMRPLFDAHNTFRQPEQIEVKQFWRIKATLCVPLPPPQLDFGKYPDTRSSFLRQYFIRAPSVTYEATRAQGFEGWHGLDLNTFDADEFNYDLYLSFFRNLYPNLDYSRSDNTAQRSNLDISLK